MWQSFRKSVLLLLFAVLLCCGLYPLSLWGVGQLVFPWQANGSRLLGADGKPLGSLLIAQPFSRDDYFQPRPSAAAYNAAASASSSLAASNYALRDRVARSLGPLVRYADGPRAGLLVAPDLERWFAADQYHGQPHLLGQWAVLHPGLAQAWVKADPLHAAFANAWLVQHPPLIAQFAKDNPTIATPAATDMAVVFFQGFSAENPGKFPVAVTRQTADGQTETVLQALSRGVEIQAIFFDLWRDEHPGVALQPLPGDMLTTSASGLDPHITLENANYQLERVARLRAAELNRDPAEVRAEIADILEDNAAAPFAGLAGDRLVNVLAVNLALQKQFVGE